jgi:hypothetical protein
MDHPIEVSPFDTPAAFNPPPPSMDHPIDRLDGSTDDVPADPFAPPLDAPDPFGGIPSSNPAVSWDAPDFSGERPLTTPTSNLEQAIPSGDDFDAGIASLLDPATETGATTPFPSDETPATGLVKRDRSQSVAPPSEGRPVSASVRSPEEIREMLARYRDGRSSRPAGIDAETNSDSGEQT